MVPAVCLLTLLVVVIPATAQPLNTTGLPIKMETTVLPGEPSVCPSTGEVNETVQGITENVRLLLHQHILHHHYDCQDAYARGNTVSGVYTIRPDTGPPFQAYCDMETEGGGWMVFQRRMDGSVDFYLNWVNYTQGFGNLTGEHWLGLDKMYRIISANGSAFESELRIDLEDFEQNTRYAKYSHFAIGDSASKYVLTTLGYSGTAGNGLGGRHNGRKFTTKDQDNDVASSANCAILYNGAWWYDKCHNSNLNGVYHHQPAASYGQGVQWYPWKGYHYSLKFSEMKMRHH